MLMMRLLSGVRSAVVIDSKQHPDEWTRWGPRHGYVVTADPAELNRHPLVIWQVDQLALEDHRGWQIDGRPGNQWTRGLRAIFARRNTVVVFDEALQTLPVQAPHPEARKMMTQGRAHGIGVWVGSQSPTWVDTFALRLAEHAFVFRTPSQDSRKRLAAERGVDCDALADLEQYEFGYHRQSAEEWTLYEPLKL